ncbi:unnamed protein product [Parnassius mnemosyne]|uniref:Gastrula zinc finger protein XlCGF57.1-like n=2 Tax=Parnassius mnemosyne TaxID=213953 RepID=A0AAV1L8P2_9NEOP
MAFNEGEVCRICLSVNVRMFALKETGLQNLYKTLTNSFMDENEGPIIVCFTCHARLIRCRRLQQQAIESNVVLEQLLAGGSMSIPKLHKVRGEIKFTPIYHMDIWPVECDIENDCKDEIFCLDAVKVEEEIFEYENSELEKNENHETEPYITPTNHFSKLSESKIKSNSTDCNINDVRKGNLDLESTTIKLKAKVKKNNQPVIKKGKHPAKIMKKKILKQKSAKNTSGAPTKFSRKDILAKHISYCHKTQKNSVTTAVRTQVEQTPVPQLTEIFNCDICEFKTSQKRYILAHLNAHIAEQMFCCNNCDYRSIKKDNLQKHMKIHTGEKPFSCHICKYQCIRKSNLQSHMTIHTGEKPFSCHICEYKFITKGNLQTHMKIHTGEKPFSCHICKYQCIQKISLQSHMKIHTGEKPFSCNVCEYKFITKSGLQRHMKIHTGEKPFSCNICEYKCITKSDLQRHMKIHTGEKLFSCNICEYKCITKDNLQTHMKIHTGEKPFSCHICKYQCIRKSSLQSHMKIHTGDKPFSCNICEYKCIIKSALQRHMKTHT